MKSFFIQPSLDTTGFWASAICALHCIAVPMLLSFSAFGALSFLENKIFEYSILGIGSIVGCCSLLPSYFRQHQKLNALLFLLTGFAMILLGQFIDSGLYEVLLTSIGALSIALAHFINYKLCQKNHTGI